MKNKVHLSILVVLGLVALSLGFSGQPPKVKAQNSSHDPTWWSKYEFIRDNGGDASPLSTTSTTVSGNVDVSNECGPQSETFITINPNKPKILAAGSNEIFRLPMRGYYSTNGGGSWGGVDLPLPPAKGANGTDFGSDPTLAFDTQGNVFYGYIVVFFEGNAAVQEAKKFVTEAEGLKQKMLQTPVAELEDARATAKEAIAAYDKAKEQCKEASKKYEEASKLKVKDKFKEYLVLKVKEYDKRVELVETAKGTPQALIDSKSRSSFISMANANNERVDRLSKEADDLAAQADKVMKDNPDMFKK